MGVLRTKSNPHIFPPQQPKDTIDPTISSNSTGCRGVAEPIFPHNHIERWSELVELLADLWHQQLFALDRLLFDGLSIYLFLNCFNCLSLEGFAWQEVEVFCQIYGAFVESFFGDLLRDAEKLVMGQELDGRLDCPEMLQHKFDRVFGIDPASHRPIATAKHQQIRLFIQQQLESLNNTIPVLLIQY